MPEPLVFIDNPHTVTFAVDRETRTIRGLALPFGDVGNGWTFGPGVLTWAEKVKVLDGHDWNRAFGLATLSEVEGGIEAVIAVARGARGDEMLALAEDGVYDGLSVGLAPGLGYEIDDNGIFHGTSGTVQELSATPFPAFENAKVTSVAASAAPTRKETTKMPESDEKVFSAAEGVALTEQVTALEAQLKTLGEIKAPVQADGQQFQVVEESIYRFSGSTPASSGFDFATDLLAAAKDGDKAALERVKKFTKDFYDQPRQFVDTGDTANVNPAQYRPDMFLGQAPVPTSPMYDTFHKGGLSDITPFFYSKLDRANTDVAVHPHVEGVEPEPDDFVTVVGTTVTPTAVSGKVHITREVGDQGGNPTVSGLILAEFDRSYTIALEQKTAALIAAVMAQIEALATIPAGAAGEIAGRLVELGLVDLQFIPDGTRFTKAFGHVDLYKALAAAEDGDGNSKYPIINPQNRNGVAGAKYSFIELAGYRFEPAHSLGAKSNNASNSIVADPNAVHVWNSGLQRLDKLQEDVEGWDIGCFGYHAGLVYDVTGLRKIAYDPTA